MFCICLYDAACLWSTYNVGCLSKLQLRSVMSQINEYDDDDDEAVHSHKHT